MSIRGTYKKSKKRYDKLDSFGIKYTSKQKPFKNLTLFNLESICLQEDTFKRTNITTWTSKHVSITASNFSNLAEEQIYFCNYDLHHLVASFAGAVENLSRAKTKNLFFDIDTTMKNKVVSNLEKITERHNQREHVKRFDMNQKHCENEKCASTQFLQIQKNHLI